MATIEPNPAYRRYPWLATRSVGKDSAARYASSVKRAQFTSGLNCVFLALQLAAGKGVLALLVLPGIAHGGHRWWHLRSHPEHFHAKDRRLREVHHAYRVDVTDGRWTGCDPVPVRFLLAPAAAVQVALLYGLVGHPGLFAALVAGVATGVLWYVAAVLSIELGIGTEPAASWTGDVDIDLTEIDLTDASERADLPTAATTAA